MNNKYSINIISKENGFFISLDQFTANSNIVYYPDSKTISFTNNIDICKIEFILHLLSRDRLVYNTNQLIEY